MLNTFSRAQLNKSQQINDKTFSFSLAKSIEYIIYTTPILNNYHGFGPISNLLRPRDLPLQSNIAPKIGHKSILIVNFLQEIGRIIEKKNWLNCFDVCTFKNNYRKQVSIRITYFMLMNSLEFDNSELFVSFSQFIITWLCWII